LWKKAHEQHGHECDFITMYPTRFDYDPGYCLKLPLISANPKYLEYRKKYYQLQGGKESHVKEKEGFPPIWEPNSKLEKLYFRWRDWLWHFKIEKAIEKLDLFNYDIYHIEWGLGLYRDGRFVQELAKRGKHIVCGYHGQDLRNRGVIKEIDSVSELNVTSELDLLDKHPNIKYLFLPFDTEQFDPDIIVNEKVKICHSPTNRYFKGSDKIIPVCERIASEVDIEFVLIENMPNSEVIKLKRDCDILIDQVGNHGGWGYGMNSVEALAMGLVCVTELIPQYVDFIPDHPFVNVTTETLYSTLKKLVKNKQLILKHKRLSREWVVKNHGLKNTTEVLYNYYDELKWL
jgi:glycosyltransferase involved in cell wall biosynthesis